MVEDAWSADKEVIREVLLSIANHTPVQLPVNKSHAAII